MRKTFSLILLALLPYLLLSQPDYALQYRNRIDSLQKLLPGAKAEKQVDLLNELASGYAPINLDSSILYSSQAVRLAKLNNYSKELGIAKFQTGNAYYFKMDFKNALINYLSAQSIFENGHYYNELGDVFMMLGHINFFIMRAEKAIFYYSRTLGYYNAAGNERALPEVYHALSLTFGREGANDSALVYCKKLLDYSKKYHDLIIGELALTLFGQTYTDEKAVAFCKEALKVAINLNDKNMIAIIYNNLASYYDRSSPLFDIHGDLKLSRYYYDKAFRATLQVDYSILQAMIPAYIAEIDIEEGKYQQAEANLRLCEEKLSAFKQFPQKTSSPPEHYSFGKIYDYYLVLRTRKDLYNALFKLAHAKGEFKKAIEYQRLYYQSRDTLNSAQQGRQLVLMMAEAEAEKTGQRIRTLSKDNELNQLKLSRTRYMFIGIGGGLVIISLFLLLFFQRKRWKAEQRSVTLEQKLLRSQMNPHFIFNSLASIQNFIVNQKANEASIYLSRFSQLVRNILDNSIEEYVPVQKEIETIQHYLELQQVRYTGQFTYNLKVDEKIDKESMMIPPMLAQPFIENAIEHGIRYKETTGHIDIRFRLEGEQIRFEVEDNGVGREKAREIEMNQKQAHRSLSTSITHDRLVKLNKKLKTKILLEIADLENDLGEACGTKVTFGIPVVEK